MPKISSIEHLASLAKLGLDADEAEGLRRDMESIMELMDSLQDVNMDGEDAPAEGAATLAGLRGDAVLREIDPELFLEQSPADGKNGFAIPRMME
ncbi:MAG: aspartyl/glutamyl-tRNA amidotransferase subunit C [Clostridiales bacterium]|jgi:aspartyl-tRNA(Asn)/glutamyl-tRNA(Gln) amidotransferase subunit C|nr:aspartyl/glutamyl-tRNA amidotransferase subunit C [Clostridiales bacterium]